MAISLNVDSMCRICLSEENLVDILMLGEPTAKWMSDIHRYFDVQLTFHDDKSTKICKRCIRKIESWRKDLFNASNNQKIIQYLDTMLQRQNTDDEEMVQRIYSKLNLS